jgi:hypothetical protein
VGFGSFFKKKKKEAEKSVNDVENMIKKDLQPENELEKMDHSFTAEKAELGNASKGSDEPKQLLTDEDNRLESNRSPNAERVVSESTFKEVTVNLDSELLRKAQAKGIDLSITLEQQLRRMVSGT